MDIEEEKTALLWESAALLYYKVERDGGHDSVSLANAELEEKRASGDYWSRTVKVLKRRFSTSRLPAPPQVNATHFHLINASEKPDPEAVKASSTSMFNMPVGPMGVPPPMGVPAPGSKSARAPRFRSSNQRTASQDAVLRTPDTAALTSSARAVEGRIRPTSGSSFEHAEGMRPMSCGDYWSRTVKLFKRRFTTSRKPAPPLVDDTYSHWSTANGPSVSGKVKVHFASLFNMRVNPMRALAPISKSTRAPSVRSWKRRTASKGPTPRAPGGAEALLLGVVSRTYSASHIAKDQG